MSFLQPEAPLALSTDASSTHLGASLDQLTDGIWHPLRFHSRKLTPSEKNYSPYDRELLAIYDALKHFQHMLEGRQFVVKTVHKPLVKALSQRPEKASPRQLHQLDFISQFCLTLQHIEGKDNVVADALSRVEAIDMPSQLTAEAIHQAHQEEDMAENHELATLFLILQYFMIEGFRILCDILTGALRSYLPQRLRRRAFDVVHSPTHPRGRITPRMLKERFAWPGIKKDALSWARECIVCQRAKIHRHTRLPPTNSDVSDQRFSHVHLDLIVLPEIDNYRYCLIIIHRFSRWPQAVPLRDIRAETVASAFYSGWISLFGTPLTITTDQGKKVHTTPYHPHSNGILERSIAR